MNESGSTLEQRGMQVRLVALQLEPTTAPAEIIHRGEKQQALPILIDDSTKNPSL